MIKKHQNRIVEIEISTSVEIKNPFWDIEVKAEFIHEEEGIRQILYGFYDGRNANVEHLWKVRWMPIHAGKWTCRIDSSPEIEGLTKELVIQVNEGDVYEKGFLRANAKDKWGLKFDNGDPFFLLGDTMYNLFGAHYCGVDVESVLRHRMTQGVNYIRARMQVSPFHPEIINNWQNKSCWPWGGSPQWPDFTRFNLAYFRAIDEVISLVADLEMGIEVIFEAWMLEFPFNDRSKFLPEYEDAWFKYIISRYTAYPSVYLWCPANEYEFYPGEAKYHIEADRFIKRLAALIREYDPYRHPIGAHNWEQKIPISERLGRVEDIDVYLIQTDWFQEIIKYNRNASLCMWLESQIKHHAPKRDKVVICAEFGYEEAEEAFTLAIHDQLDHNHTRRGQWRAGFSGYPIVHGFNNTWGPHLKEKPDAKGAQYLIHFYRFMTEDIKFYEMSSTPELLKQASGSEDEGTLPLCLSNHDCSVISVYFPTKGHCQLNLAGTEDYVCCWLNPRTGEKTEKFYCKTGRMSSPESNEGNESWGDDWILLLKK